MPTLEECSEQIGKLVNEKGFNSDVLFFKLVWGQIELAEALDLVKKYGLPDIGIDGTGKHWKSIPWRIGEEIVDTVFYCVDGYRLLRRKYPELPTMDEMFEWKMGRNMGRPKRYGQKWATSFLKAAVDHFHDEGILNEMMLDMLDYVATKKYQPGTLFGKPVDMSGSVEYCASCRARTKHHDSPGVSEKGLMSCDDCGNTRQNL